MMRALRKRLQDSTVKKEVMITVIIPFLFMFALLYSIFCVGMENALRERENQSIHNEANLIKGALYASNEHLVTMLENWAVWDSTYTFSQDNLSLYLEYDLSDFVYQNYNLDFITMLDLDGEVILERFFSREEASIDLTYAYKKLGPMNTATVELYDGADELSRNRLGLHGFMQVDGELVYISAYPILRTVYTGPSVGSMLLGRVMKAADLDSLKDNSRTRISIQGLANAALTEAEIQTLTDSGILITVSKQDDLTARLTIQDIFGDEQLLLTISGPRYLYRQGEAMMLTMLGITALCSAALMLMILRFLRSVIVKPLGQLVKAVNNIDFETLRPLPKSDWNNKEFNILVKTFNGMLSRIETDRNIIKQNNERLYQNANFDMLTALPNRTHCAEKLEKAIAFAKGDGTSIGVFFVDLDRLKFINDTLGRSVGDLFIEAVARRLENSLTSSATAVGRVDGGTFVVIAEGLRQETQARAYSEDIHGLFSEPFVVEDREMNITTSIGFSLYPMDGKDVATLFKTAEMAMYRAKSLGRNTCCRYESWLKDVLQNKLHVINNIRAAIHDQFRPFQLYFQPKVLPETGEIKGCEALIRWITPEGIISPGDFIPLAEESGLIVPLSYWVLNEAFRYSKLFAAKGIHNRISINLSAQVLMQKNFLETLHSAAKHYGANPEVLDIEITEATLVEDAQQVNTILEALHAMGITVSIDDFGTGYSSLSYLRKLPVNRIKIDRSFIVDMNGKESRSIVNAIIAMAKSLHLVVTAEGVEDAFQYEYLKSINCEEIQGYCVSRPVPFNEYVEFIKHIPQDVSALLHQ